MVCPQTGEAGVQSDFCRRVLDQLHDDFTLKELRRVLAASELTLAGVKSIAGTGATVGILQNRQLQFAD